MKARALLKAKQKENAYAKETKNGQGWLYSYLQAGAAHLMPR
jgi:hypothetical protein